ncbi:MAG: N-6 DNA methylase [Polyangia bacterium]|nr:N-6 DNA methylase [Polyangia bacterium]
MGRGHKVVPSSDGIDRRETGFYRTPGFVAQYLARRILERRPGLGSLVDPCVGDGAFLEPFLGAGYAIRGMDILALGPPAGLRFERTDFLAEYEAWREGQRSPWPEDAWVLNPPYNCHEAAYIREHKPRLGALFPDLGVPNLYGLFLAAAVSMAKPGALLGVLTQDSFLTARIHAPLRRLLLGECALHELLLCPTDLFRAQGADVRTCVLLLEKGGEQGRVRVLDRPTDISGFRLALAGDPGDLQPLEALRLSGDRDHGELLVGVPGEVRALFDQPRLGASYPTITGISTGEDRRFLRPEPSRGHSVPFYKNPGRRKFYCEPDAYLPDDFLRLGEDVPGFQVRNRELLPLEGLVCSSMGVPFGACLRPAGTAFGVNANVVPGRDAWWLLGYLNSSLVTYLVRGVLRRANMVTAGYVARVPLPPLDASCRRALGQAARRAYRLRLPPERLGQTTQAIDSMLGEALRLSPETAHKLEEFAADPVRRA